MRSCADRGDRSGRRALAIKPLNPQEQTRAQTATRGCFPLGPPLQSGALKSNEVPSPQSVRQYTSRVPSKGGAFRWERDGNSGTSPHATLGEACADRPGSMPNHEPPLRSRDLVSTSGGSVLSSSMSTNRSPEPRVGAQKSAEFPGVTARDHPRRQLLDVLAKIQGPRHRAASSGRNWRLFEADTLSHRRSRTRRRRPCVLSS